MGRRDYAILMMLAKLGLRASEVATLTLDDVDWRSGEMLIRAKGRQRAKMPLPPEVGAAVVTYLRDGRPRSSCRRLFLRTLAPLRRLADAARPVGGRGVQGRPSSREDADAADGDRDALSPSAHDQARARPRGLSVPAARPDDRAAEPGVGDGHHLHSDGAWLRLSGRGARLVQSPGAVVAAVDYHGSGVLHRDVGGRFGTSRQAGHLQHRPGLAVHRGGLHRRARRQRHCDQHGRQGRLARQRVRRAAVAQRQIRGGLSARLRQRVGRPRLDRPLLRLLQPRIRTPILLCD